MTALPRRLAALVRTADAAELAAVSADDAVYCVDMRESPAAVLLALFERLEPAQRAGLVVSGGEGRTIVIAPSAEGRPAGRKLFLFSHPDGRSVTEVVAYSDDTPLEALTIGTPGGDIGRLPVRDGGSGVPLRALVTASSDTLGAAIARGLHDAGVPTVWQGTRAEGPQPAGAAYVRGDIVADPERVVIEAAAALGGPISVLVNNLGPWDATPVAAADPAQWRRAIDHHVGAALRVAQLVAPGMRELGWGRIVNISAGSAGTRDHGLYGLGKSFLEELTESLAFELAPAITVNALSPGQIQESVPAMTAIDPTAVARMVHRTPAGRLVTRAEIAALVRSLCEPAFDMVTGTVIPVDGGYRIPRN